MNCRCILEFNEREKKENKEKQDVYKDIYITVFINN